MPSEAPSLRARFALGFTIACVLLVALLAVAALGINARQESELVDQIVSDEMEELIEQYERREMVAGPPASTLRRFDVRGESEQDKLRKWFRANWLTHSYIARGSDEIAVLPPELRPLAPGFHDIESNGVRFRVEVREIGSVHFYLAYSIEHHQARLDQFRLAVALSVGISAIVGSLLAFWLSGLLTRPVAELAMRVEGLGDGVPGEALASHFPEREVAALAQAFDAFQARTNQLLERERAFTADVSHELRTPLTSIRTSSELMLADDALSPKSRQRVAKIARSAVRLTELVDAFLLLAREQAGGSRSEVHLLDCVDDAADQVRERAEAKGLRLRVEVAPDLRVTVPLNALRVVLSNLLANAVSYTEQGEIAIGIRDGCVEISDTGPGMPAGELPELLHRFRRGSEGRGEGFGLGLAIVRRICEQTGWQLTIDPRDGGGSRIRVGPL